MGHVNYDWQFYRKVTSCSTDTNHVMGCSFSLFQILLSCIYLYRFIVDGKDNILNCKIVFILWQIAKKMANLCLSVVLIMLLNFNVNAYDRNVFQYFCYLLFFSYTEEQLYQH